LLPYQDVWTQQVAQLDPTATEWDHEQMENTNSLTPIKVTTLKAMQENRKMAKCIQLVHAELRKLCNIKKRLQRKLVSLQGEERRLSQLIAARLKQEHTRRLRAETIIEWRDQNEVAHVETEYLAEHRTFSGTLSALVS
jgi:uncharacterized protein (DUF3084 family)